LKVQEERLVRDLAQAEAALQDLQRRREESDALGQAQLAQAEAQYEQAWMNWVDAQSLPPWDHDRARVEQQLKAAEAALEEVKARVAASAAGPAEEAAARAAVTAAREALAQVREQRSQVELRSPAAGTLLQVEVDAGESVTAGQLLMRLADLDVVEVIAEVDEVDIAQVRPGMSASVTITGDRRADVLVLPLAALTVREGSNGVFVLEGQTVRFRPVETGLVSTTQAEVIAGLGEGDTVVVGPLAILRMLQDGTPVQAIPVGDVEP